MKNIEKIILIILTAVCSTSCSNGHRAKPAIISGNISFSFEEDSSEVVLDEPTLKALDELNVFLNADLVDLTAYLIAVEPNLEIPIADYYVDEDIIVQTDLQNDGIQEITTRDKSFIEGDGFKVYKTANNEKLFENEYIDYTNYMNSIVLSNNSLALEFRINLMKLPSNSLFSYESMSELSTTYGLNLKDMLFVASFKDGKVSALSTAFQGYFESLHSNVTLIYAFVVKGYEQSLVKREIDLSGYLEVDNTTFFAVSNDIKYFLKNGTGYFANNNNKCLCLYDAKNEAIFDNEIVGYLYLDGDSSTTISVKSSETVYDKDNKQCIYDFAGKEFVFAIDPIPVIPLTKSAELSFDKVDHNYDGAICFDYENNRIILESHGKICILNNETFEIIKEFTVEGEIANIINHKDVYHVMTATEVPDDIYDNNSKGSIYVIDKNALTITELKIGVFPYNTIIDKRGNIFIAPGWGQHNYYYLYDIETGTTKIVNGNYPCSPCGYLKYNETEDYVITNETHTYGGISPYYFYFQDGEYRCERKRLKEHEDTSFGNIYFEYQNFIVAEELDAIVDISDFENPNRMYYFKWKYEASKPIICFANDNTIYILIGDSYGNTILIKNDIIDGEMVSTNYYIQESVYNFGFGLVKDGKIYLFNDLNKSFSIYNID